jgi:hypothetical protein
MSEDAWPHRAATDEDTQPTSLNGAGVIEDVAQDSPQESLSRESQTDAFFPGPNALQGRPEADARPEDPRGESPDLLRWRAEMLLDEMMVGAVDASAGEVGVYRPAPFIEAEQRAAEPWQSPVREATGRAPTTARPVRAPRPIVPGNLGEPPITPYTNGAGAFHGANGGPATGTKGSNGHHNGTHTGNGVAANDVNGVEHGSSAGNGPAPMPPYQPATVSRVIPPASAPPAVPMASALLGDKDALRASRRTENSTPPAPSRSGERHPYDDEPARKVTPVEQRYPRTTSRRVEPLQPPSTGRHADDLDADEGYVQGLGPIRRNPAVIRHDPVAGAMAVGSLAGRHASKYAQLLPRSTPWDEHEMQREIAALADEMARVLPAGHESSRRARHLLEKAQTIFTSDPLRSAEVDYYLSQVRAIVQRSRQTVQWSGLYRKRLVLYHTAWLLFAGLVVATGLLYGAQLAGVLGILFGWVEGGFLARAFVPGLVSVLGGAFGGALGGLLNLQRYLRRDLGYIDRKYSLRGLMLPVIGLMVGFVLFGVVAAAMALVGWSGVWPIWLELAPALLAFGLGLLQESIYGTRE